jgi:ubiquinone/menaquinone biosynthesis C-methylase UbiE
LSLQVEHRAGVPLTVQYLWHLDNANCEVRYRDGIAAMDPLGPAAHPVNRRTNLARQVWGSRAASWEGQVSASPAFDRIRSATIEAAELTAADVVVDLGAGTGLLTLACAAEVQKVIAVDLSPEMLRVLQQKAVDRGLQQIEVVIADLAQFDLPPKSVDVVMSSYALHHLRDRQKAALVRRAGRWLRPGGRLVITDMMFGRGLSLHDREVLGPKVGRMIKRGPAGIWRVVKNVVRFGLHIGNDLPVPSEFWVRQLRAAGFSQVEARVVVAEATLVVGRRPDADQNDATL